MGLLKAQPTPIEEDLQRLYGQASPPISDRNDALLSNQRRQRRGLPFQGWLRGLFTLL